MIPASYDPITLNLLTRAFDEAWADVEDMLGAKALDPGMVRAALAKRIMDAADKGERDPKRLKLIALRAIDS